jgi:aminomethyltransferase
MESESLRRTPLYECHRAAGARLVGFAGWEMPERYASIIDEHRAVRSAAGLFDVSHMGEIAVRGAGAEAFLQVLTPNDVSKLRPGRAHYSGLLTEEGTYIDDLLVYRRADESFMLVVNASNAEGDLEWILAHRPEGVEVEDLSDRTALLALQGPLAPSILAPLTPLDLGTLRYYGFAESTVGGARAVISRTGYTGEDGFELYLEVPDAARVWDRLMEAGAPAGLVPAGLGARDTLRLEAAMALYGHEIDRTTTPWEASLGWVVKLDKGDFVGREALVAQRQAGIPRQLVGFEVRGRGIARQGHPIVDGDEEVGVVTSGTWSPTFEKALGMGYVPRERAAHDGELAVEVRGRRVSAQVVDLPFYRRSRS